jgi:septal ring factor EnvC (AmiA/AmiB activator)
MTLSITDFANVSGPKLVAGLAFLFIGAVTASAEPSARSPAFSRLAQADAPRKDGSLPGDLQQRDLELEAVRTRQREAAETLAKLKREVAEIGTDYRKLNEQLIDTAKRLREVEGRIATTEHRLQPLDEQERTIRSSLEGRRAVIAEVLAALQRMGRRPPPAILVRPEDALQSVRTAILLGAVLPEMRTQAQTLADELHDLVRIRKEITTERERLSRDLAALSSDRERLNLLIEQRQTKQATAEKTLADQRRSATALARQTSDLKELIAKLEQGLDANTRAARAAVRATEDAKLGASRPAFAALNDPGRLAPAVAFASTRGRLPMPVNGVKIRDYGASDGAGGAQKGLSIATRAGAQVTAPCDGWVVYAGAFRSYGQLLILDAGGGYHVLLAGMDRISIDLGQFVLTGEPVGVMGGGSSLASALSTGSSQSVLYVEFRKDGTPVDPSPWWATKEGEKVRG